jgi:uncharacterized membrane protein YdjX (TVP38/TMEM64 family)
MEEGLRQALLWVDSLGPWAPAAFVLLYAGACLALLPASVLTIGAGLVFGPWKGFLLVSAGATLGATLAFLTGRHVARGWVQSRLARNPRLAALDEAVARAGWKAVFLLRLSPLFPFVMLNYALGLTRVDLKGYVLATWIGMMPGILAFVFLGHSARRPGYITLIGAAATLLAAGLIGREAKRALTAGGSASAPRE